MTAAMCDEGVNINILLGKFKELSEEEFVKYMESLFPDGNPIIKDLSEVKKKDYELLSKFIEFLSKVYPEEVFKINKDTIPESVLGIIFEILLNIARKKPVTIARIRKKKTRSRKAKQP